MVDLAIGSKPRRKISLSRRQMLQLAAAMSVSSACSPSVTNATQKDGIVPWPHDLPVPEVTHAGYGTFPDYFEIGESGPWAKILSDHGKIL
jgi:hypothetical protein